LLVGSRISKQLRLKVCCENASGVLGECVERSRLAAAERYLEAAAAVPARAYAWAGPCLIIDNVALNCGFVA
jgi:hypothetical protein